MHNIIADHHRATAQAVSEAISHSHSHDEIVYLECLSEGTFTAVCDELMRDCEGETYNTAAGCHEFWGRDAGENPWRVHVYRTDTCKD